MSYASSYQQRSQQRINSRENRKRQLGLNSQDMFSTKATVMIAMSMLEDILADLFKKRKSEEDKLRDMIAKIEKARAEGKDLDREILENKDFQEALREIDPNKYEENMELLKQVAEKSNRTLKDEVVSLRVEDVVSLKENVSEKDTQTQKTATTNRQKNRQ